MIRRAFLSRTHPLVRRRKETPGKIVGVHALIVHQTLLFGYMGTCGEPCLRCEKHGSRGAIFRRAFMYRLTDGEGGIGGRVPCPKHIAHAREEKGTRRRGLGVNLVYTWCQGR